VCAERDCHKNAYICSSERCTVCSEAHQNCDLKFTFEVFSKVLSKNLEKQKESAKIVFELHSMIAAEVDKVREELKRYICLKGVNSEIMRKAMETGKESVQLELRSSDIWDTLQ
jgi:molybdopterin converting factor small subunit